MKKYCIAIFMLLLTFGACFGVSAEGTVGIATESDTVTISGTVQAGTKLVSIAILKEDSYWTRSSQTPADAKCVDEFRDGTDEVTDFVSYIATVSADSNGKWSLTVKKGDIPSKPEIRIYTAATGYVYYSPRELTAMNDANETTSPTFRETVEASAYVGGAVSEKISSLSADRQTAFWKIYLQKKNALGGFESLEKAVEAIDECVDMSALHVAATADDLDKFLKTCEAYGIKESNSYDLYRKTGVFTAGELTSAAKAKLTEDLLGKKTSFSDMKTFIEAFWDKTCFYALTANSSRFHVQSVLKKSDRVSASDLSKFLAADDDAQLAASNTLVSSGANYQTISEAVKAVESAVTSGGSSESNSVNKNPSNANRGGGGGGGGIVLKSDPVVPEPDSKDEKKSFSDLGKVAWAEEAIYALRDAGILNGRSETEFDPNSAVTREEFTKLLVLALGAYDESAVADFADCADGAWYTPYVASGRKKGLISGLSEDVFGVGRSISRQEMAVMIARGAIGGEVPTADNSGFADDEKVSGWAKGAVSYVRENGLMSGMGDNSFAPLETVTRAQAAKAIYGLINGG